MQLLPCPKWSSKNASVNAEYGHCPSGVAATIRDGSLGYATQCSPYWVGEAQNQVELGAPFGLGELFSDLCHGLH